MNELFEFRKHLNTKKIIGLIFLIIILIIAIIFFSFSKHTSKKENNKDDSNPYKVYYSADTKVSLELPKRYNLQEVQSDNILQLQSEDGLLINIEEKTIILGKALKDIATSDRNIYTKKFENVSDISDLQEFNLQNSNILSSYKYSFNFTTQNKSYYVQVFWIQSNTEYYIITLNIPQNHISKYQSIETEIISSFKMS